MVSLPRNNRYSFVLVMEYIGRSRTELGIMITFILQEIKGTSLTLADNSAKLNIVNVIFSISFLKKKNTFHQKSSPTPIYVESCITYMCLVLFSKKN